jgi:hypothetical protein
VVLGSWILLVFVVKWPKGEEGPERNTGIFSFLDLAPSSLEMARSCRKSGLPVVVGAQVGETSILTRAALPIAQFLGAACRAQEGAYGLHLLQRDVVSHSIQFGRGGRLLPPPIFHGFGWGLDCNLNGLDEPRAC